MKLILFILIFVSLASANDVKKINIDEIYGLRIGDGFHQALEHMKKNNCTPQSIVENKNFKVMDVDHSIIVANFEKGLISSIKYIWGDNIDKLSLTEIKKKLGEPNQCQKSGVGEECIWSGKFDKSGKPLSLKSKPYLHFTLVRNPIDEKVMSGYVILSK